MVGISLNDRKMWDCFARLTLDVGLIPANGHFLFCG